VNACCNDDASLDVYVWTSKTVSEKCTFHQRYGVVQLLRSPSLRAWELKFNFLRQLQHALPGSPLYSTFRYNMLFVSLRVLSVQKVEGHAPLLPTVPVSLAAVLLYYYCLLTLQLKCVGNTFLRHDVKLLRTVIMAALRSRCGHYIFVLCCFLPSSSLLFFSSPNLSCLRLDVYHTSTHGVALVRI